MEGFQHSLSRWMAAGVTAAVAGLVVAGCGGGSAINKAEFDKIKTVAVLVYTVPETIEYRRDPKDTNKSLLQAVVQAAAQGNPARAATLSHESFSAGLSGKVPFRVLTADEVRNNKEFIALNVTELSKKPQKKDEGTMGKLLALTGGGQQDRFAGTAPNGLPQFGLVPYGSNPLNDGGADQQRYLVAAIKALNVDAAIIVNDIGYSFSCNACVGGTGDGSTGSAFTSAIVNKEGKLVGGVQQWFGTSSGHAAMVAYAVNPLQHESLFKAHGTRMAEVFIEQLQDDGALPKKK